jgi:hypothetical protein
VEGADWIPFGEAMERIERARFSFSQDRWETWVRCRLVEPAARIPGTNSYGLRRQQWMKLKVLIAIDSQLFGRRSPEAIAYFAATLGVEVPADLVADYIVSSIHTYYTLLRRRIIQQSSGRRDPRMLTESDVHKLAKKTASDFMAMLPRIRNPAKRFALDQLARSAAFMMLCIAYDVKPPGSLSETVRSIANGIFRGSAAALGAAMLRRVLERESGRFVDPQFGENKIIQEVLETQRKAPALLLRACRDSGLALQASIKGFGLEENQRKGRPPNHLKGTARENARAFYALLPMSTGFFLSMNLDNPNDAFLTMLRTDEGAKLESVVRRLDRASEWQRRRLERGL